MLALFALLPAIDPKYAMNITVYHVNEHKYGAIPVNMNTGDNTGDLFFDLLEVLLSPLACANSSGPSHPGPDPCTNPEAIGDDLMVNKLILEVDTRFSGYAACNVGINGSDPFGNPCETDTYCCECTSNASFPPKPVACNATLGYENVYDQFAVFIGNATDGCQPSKYMPDPSPADCYTINTFGKLTEQDHGSWYSSLEQGYCGNAGSACTWRVVSVEKIVQRQCHATIFGEAVQQHGDPACLDGCGDQRNNISSPCWVDCFYKAALGPDAGKVGGAVAGLTLDQLKAAWTKPFLPERLGGCPAQSERPPWFAGKTPWYKPRSLSPRLSLARDVLKGLSK